VSEYGLTKYIYYISFNVPHIIGHFGDDPPSNHLHWYGQQKLTAKSIKPTHKKTKYNNILPTYTCTQTYNINQQKAHTRTIYIYQYKTKSLV